MANKGTVDVRARVAALREGLELSQRELARRLGVTQPTVNAYEKGKDGAVVTPSAPVLQLIEALELALQRKRGRAAKRAAKSA